MLLCLTAILSHTLYGCGLVRLALIHLSCLTLCTAALERRCVRLSVLHPLVSLLHRDKRFEYLVDTYHDYKDTRDTYRYPCVCEVFVVIIDDRLHTRCVLCNTDQYSHYTEKYQHKTRNDVARSFTTLYLIHGGRNGREVQSPF